MNREAWLTAAAAALAPMFTEHDYEIPELRVSVGFPGGRGKKAGVIGQCWSSGASADEKPQIFIHPSLTDVPQILGTLAHEIAHAIDDCESGHKGQFVRIIRAIGLTGKPTEATMFDPEVDLDAIISKLGEYPHAALAAMSGGGGEKKQSTRMLKLVCAVDGLDSPYKLRMTRTIIDTYGAPSCPCHDEAMEEAA